jgi:hypothetical protein
MRDKQAVEGHLAYFYVPGPTPPAEVGVGE